MSLSILIASAMLGASSTPVLAASAPGLGSAANFAVLSAAPGSGGAVTCTNGTISGNVGSTGAAASVVQTPCSILGSITAPVAAQVVTDFNGAFAAYAAIPCDQVLTGTLAGVTLGPGVYCFAAAAALTGTLTLDGPSTGTWIFKIGTGGTGALTGSSFSVVMAGGGLPCSVSWQVAQAATMTDSNFIGTILAGADLTLTRGTFIGDALATAGWTTTGTTITGCPPPPPTADIGITKTVDNPTPSLGSNVTFTITATNHGPDNATGVQVTDKLPAGLSLVLATPSVGTYDSGTGVWNIGSLANGANTTLSMIATVTGTAAVTNTATRTAEDQVDPVSGNDSATATVTALGADIAITKTVDNATPNLGSNVTFTITATNNGPGNSTGLQVTDRLPAGLTFVSATPSAGTYSSVTGIWNVGALANSANATLSITATVTGTGPVTNTASRTAEDQLDPVSGNDSATATVTALGADIAITKTVDNATPNLGSNVTFTVTATDNGPSNATGVQVSDVLPAGLTFASAVASTGTYSSATGAWSIGSLANGVNATLAITASVTSASPMTNTASRSAEDQLDPVSGNNSATATVNPVAADIAITKTVDNATPSLGSNVTFTVTATNNGPSNATGVQVTDLLPAGLTFASAVASTGTYTAVSGIWNLGALANGANATLSIVATVTGTAAVTNTATKTAAVQPDPVSGNDSATATVTALGADIAITKTVDNATPNLGSNVTFTITATNNGPSNATGVQVSDVLPAGLTFASAVASTGTYNSATGAWSIGSLANGGNATLAITASVASASPMTNTASKSAEDQLDPVSANNSATATVNPVAADIAITKTVDNATPNLGSNVTFTVTATNNGPSNATGVQVTDLLPAGLTFASAVASTGTYTAVSGIWSLGALGNGSGATLSIIATVTGTATVTNTAAKTAEAQPDPVSGNNTASATVTGQAADIAITKTVDNATPSLGSNVTFTVTATNNGPSNATGVQVTDLVPAGLTFASAVASTGTYTAVTGIWSLGALANGANATLSIIAAVTGTTAVTNTASKTAEVQLDPNGGNNTAGATVTGQAADIGITKTVDNPTPNVGSNVIFTITATNSGPSNATGVQVTDHVPGGLAFVSALQSTGSYNPFSGVWNIGALANGSSATLSITATVTGATAVTNFASISGEVQVDPVSANNTASAGINPVAADIAITQTVDNATPNLGSNVTFTITATNNGPSNATGVRVTDVLPAGLSFVSAVASAGAFNSMTGIWNIGALANGSSSTVSITATMTGTATVTNTAAKTAGVQPDLVPGNDSASVTVTGQAADIGVTKTVSSSTPNLGSNVIFTITTTNHGPSNATGVQVTDIIPAGLTLVLASASTGAYNAVTGIWNIGPLANLGNATLSIIATVTGSIPVTNTAAKTAEDQTDSVSANDSASVTVTGQAADIGVTKTVDNPTPNTGSDVIFTITVTNHGPSNATGVRVTDIIPAGLTVVSASASTGTYDAVTGIWNIGPLANLGNATLSVIATVAGTAAVANTATKTAEDQPDSITANNSATVTVTGQPAIGPAADIAVAKTVDNPIPDLGTIVTFTITATNHGPSNATGVQVTDQLPAGLTIVSATASIGTYDPVTGVWNIGPLANLQNATLSIIATVTVTTAVTNFATKTAEVQPDPVSSNDSASATITGQSADIGVTKAVDNPTPNRGSEVTFTITATNHGPSGATGVQVTDLLPAGLTFVSATESSGTYNSVRGLWNIGPLANLGNATLSIIATVTGSIAVTNTAAKTAEVQPDLVPSNDSASATVTGQEPDPALPGLPNTSAPDTNSGGRGPNAPKTNPGLVLAIVATLAGLGVLAGAGIRQARNRAVVGRRRSTRRQRQNPGGLAIGLLAVVLGLAISSSSVGDIAPSPPPSGAAFAPVTQLIGSKVVSVVPPTAPQGEAFQRVASPITPSRLRIPAIGVDTSIGAVGLRANGSMDVPDNLWTSSWLGSGPRPGQAGNAVIAGHRGIGSPALFSHLENLRPGDRIYVSDAAGNELIYVVTRVASLDLSTSTQLAVFGPASGPHLVLITCFGRYIPSAHTYDHRLVVFSTLLPLI